MLKWFSWWEKTLFTIPLAFSALVTGSVLSWPDWTPVEYAIAVGQLAASCFAGAALYLNLVDKRDRDRPFIVFEGNDLSIVDANTNARRRRIARMGLVNLGTGPAIRVNVIMGPTIGIAYDSIAALVNPVEDGEGLFYLVEEEPEMYGFKSRALAERYALPAGARVEVGGFVTRALDGLLEECRSALEKLRMRDPSEPSPTAKSGLPGDFCHVVGVFTLQVEVTPRRGLKPYTKLFPIGFAGFLLQYPVHKGLEVQLYTAGGGYDTVLDLMTHYWDGKHRPILEVDRLWGRRPGQTWITRKPAL